MCNPGTLTRGAGQNQPNLNTRGQKRKRLRILNAAAKTRIVSVAKIRLDPWKSVRPLKVIFFDDIAEFESSMPSQTVRSPPANLRRPLKTAPSAPSVEARA